MLNSPRHARLHVLYLALVVLLLGSSVAYAQNEGASADSTQANKVGEVQSASEQSRTAAQSSGITKATSSEQGSSDRTSLPLGSEAQPSSVSNNRLSGGVKLNDWLVMVLSLGLIVALIFILAWLARRFGGMRAVGIKDMQVLSAMPLGTREKLALVEVKGKQILIGVTHSTINHIHTFSDADLSAYAAKADQHAPQQSEFANKLKQMLSRDSSIEPDSSKSHDS